MKFADSRVRLLSGVALGLGMTMVASQPAQAACVAIAPNINCASNTTTTDTSLPANPGADRNVDFTISAVNLTVDPGVVVDGFGLAVTDIGAPPGSIVTYVNNGTVQVNLGNTASAGGLDGALAYTGIDSILNYSGTGSIINLGTGDGFEALFTGTGSMTAVFGGAVSADAGNAININSTAATGGAISITTGSVTASGGDGINIATAGSGNVTVISTNGIQNAGGGAGTLQNGIDISSTGTGNISISHTNGAIGNSGSLAQGTGILAVINNAASAGTIGVTTSAGTGINSVGDGINLSTNGTGAVTVTNAAAIASDDDGIEVASTGTGAISVANSGVIGVLADRVDEGIVATGNAGVGVTNTGSIFANNYGIRATATNGGVTVNSGTLNATVNGINAITINGTSCGTGLVNVTGNITAGNSGVYTNSCGTSTVNVNAGMTVTGTNWGVVTENVTSATVNVSGTVNDGAFAAVQFFAGAGTLNILSGGIVNGNVNGNAAATAQTVAVASGGTWNATGASDFGGGTDAVTNAAGGIINTATGSTMVGLETLTNAGTVNVTGTLGFSGVATALTSSGTLNLTAGSAVSGLGVVTTSGATNAGAGSSVSNTGNYTNSGTLTTAGAFNLTTTATFLNSGTLVLAPATFTLAGATAFNNSGTIRAEGGATTITAPVALNNTGTIDLTDGATGDFLTITGNYNAGAGATLTTDISQTAADRLLIGGNVTGGTTNVVITPVAGTTGIDTSGILIVDVTGTAAANAFTTNSVLNGIVNYAIEQRGVDFFVVSIPNVNAFAPVLLGNLVQDTWYQGSEAFTAMAAARGGEVKEGRNFSIWLQGYYQRERYGDATHTFTTLGRSFTIPTRMRTTRQGIQGGVDFNGGMASFGVTGGLQYADLDTTTPNSKGWNVGAYAMVGGTAGMYGNVLAKYDSNKVTTGLGPRTDSNSYGADGEIGYRFPGSGSIGMDLSAGLAYVNSTIDDFAFGGINYEYDDLTSLRGRLGARAVFNKLNKLFVGAKAMHEFNGDTDLTLNSGTDAFVDNHGKGTWGRAEIGMGGTVDMPILFQGWVDFGNVKGWGIRGGVRF